METKAWGNTFQSRVQIAASCCEVDTSIESQSSNYLHHHDPLREEDQKKLAKLLAQHSQAQLSRLSSSGDLGRFQMEWKPFTRTQRNPDISTCYERFTECNFHPADKCSKYSKTKHEKISAKVLQALQSSLVATPVPQAVRRARASPSFKVLMTKRCKTEKI